MKEKHDRKAIVAGIIKSRDIHTQEELMAALLKKGINVTQATLSRDIKALGAVKVNDERSGQKYMLPASKSKVVAESYIKSVDVSGQLCVVHCRPGFAPAVASMIDHAVIDGVMGTIAGDDTVLVALREAVDPADLTEAIRSIV